MGTVVLTEAYFAKVAGWEAMKRARALLEGGQVLSSNWSAPILKGVVQTGGTSYRSGLVIKGETDVENMCSCRDSREWGTICAHSVAVGLHHLRRNELAQAPLLSTSSRPGNNLATAKPVISSAPAVKGLLFAEAGGVGEALELFVILPPNFTQALDKGKVTLFFEARTSRGRTPLNVLSKSTRFAASEQDQQIVRAIEGLAGGETPAMLMLDANGFAGLLPRLVKHSNITLGKSQSLELLSEPWKPSLDVLLEANGEITVRLRGGTALPTVIEGQQSVWVYHNHTLQPLGLTAACRDCLRGAQRIPRSRVPQFLSQDWPVLQTSCQVTANFRIDDFVCEPEAPRFIFNLTGGLAHLHGQLQCRYGQRIMTVGVTASDEVLWLPDPLVPTRYSTRNMASEQAALGRILRCGFTGPDAQGRYQLAGQNRVLTFFARDYPKLEKEWETSLEERLEKTTAQNVERIEPRFQITASGERWFDLEISYDTRGGEKFSAADIQRLILSGQSHTRLRNGKFAVIDTGAVEELQEVLLDCAPQQREGGYRIGNAQAGFLEASLQGVGLGAIQAPAVWRERAAKQSGEAKLEVPPLGELDSVLRPYQKHGVAWLWFLRQNQFGGILADEMGLGKTLQTLAFLQAAKAVSTPETRRPCLIVCPTSLVFNWVAEANKFTPHLKVIALNGPERHKLFPLMGEADLVITSYALIRRDAERYREIEFDTAVLDEAQHIKNRQSQNSQAVKSVKAKHRLVLTGTPLENSVLDLWSIFDFLMPGYLGAAQDFRERYEIAITRDKDAGSRERLARRLRPFMLRRLKRDVAKDLPAKIEQVTLCELTEDQKGIYKEILEASRREVLNAVGEQGMGKSRMVVLSALLRLRQACCDLRLLKLPNIEAVNASGKLDLFGELLEEVLDGGHRALVFSQFVEMLTLIRERLDSEGIDYCYLDGSTKDRAAVVERFQKNNQIPVFLISLKAGGTGLNLTGADTVIHFDPWWNPAVEDQATDRAHRIGQTQVVTSYKLITRGTVEEKIVSLQARKRELFQATVGGEEQLTTALTWEEIQDLFAG